MIGREGKARRICMDRLWDISWIMHVFGKTQRALLYPGLRDWLDSKKCNSPGRIVSLL
jgi:hypothetical protein